MSALRWLEITPDYRCNNRCLGCYAVQDGGQSMDAREIVSALSLGLRRGARWLWVGGGEPTMRKDLFAAVARARSMGYERVKLQTNGMMLAYPAFARRLAESGVTEVAFSVKGAGAETHDRLAQTPGCHALMVEGMAQARAAGMALEADVLVYRSNARELPEMVRAYHARGVERFRLWLLSAAESVSPEVRAEVPRIADVVPFVTAAMDLGLSTDPGFVTSLHTPPCTVPATHHACLFDARAFGLLVTNPGGHAFALEESPIEGGTYPAGCDGCAWRETCRGARADYIAIHGDAEFRAPR